MQTCRKLEPADNNESHSAHVSVVAMRRMFVLSICTVSDAVMFVYLSMAGRPSDLSAASGYRSGDRLAVVSIRAELRISSRSWAQTQLWACWSFAVGRWLKLRGIGQGL